MRRHLPILLIIACGCSAPERDDGTPDAPDMFAEPETTVALLDWYDGTAELPDGESVEVEIRFVESSDGRALMRVGEFGAAWGYGAQFAVDGQTVRVETSAARCTTECPVGALSLEGVADGDTIRFTTVEVLGGGDAPFVALRAVPHDGVKPVLNPQVDFTYDPEPIAGVYPGIVYALSDTAAVNAQCTLELDAAPLRAAAFDCHELSGIDDDGDLLWDEERGLLNVPVGPDDARLLLVAELTARHDGAIEGVLAELSLGEAAISPADVPHDALVGLVELREDGIR